MSQDEEKTEKTYTSTTPKDVEPDKKIVRKFINAGEGDVKGR